MDLHITLGIDSFYKKDYALALFYFSLALQENPDSKDGRLGAILSDMASEKEMEATALFEYYLLSKESDQEVEKDTIEEIIGLVDNSIESIYNLIEKKDDKFDFTISNPPFHKSEKEASQGSKRKVQNLTKTKVKKAILNFAGQANELWCEGGEIVFIKKMINQSVMFKDNCLWFTTLVSKKDNLETIYKFLDDANTIEYKTIDMQQGQKISRIVAWTFLTKQQQQNWRK